MKTLALLAVEVLLLLPLLVAWRSAPRPWRFALTPLLVGWAAMTLATPFLGPDAEDSGWWMLPFVLLLAALGTLWALLLADGVVGLLARRRERLERAGAEREVARP